MLVLWAALLKHFIPKNSKTSVCIGKKTNRSNVQLIQCYTRCLSRLYEGELSIHFLMTAQLVNFYILLGNMKI